MKKKTIQKVLLGLCFVLFLANCGGDSAGGDEGPTLSVSPTSVELKATGSEQVTISVNSNTSWTVSGVADWIKLGSNSGSKNGSFNIWAEDNKTGMDRSTTITIQVSRGSVSKTVTVKQLADGSVITKLFEEPCLEWGGSVATVKSYMRNLGYSALYDGELQQVSNGWILAYQPKYKEAETWYNFATKTSGLQDVIVIFYLSQVGKEDFVKAFNEKGYKYSFTDNGYDLYLTKDGKSYVTFYQNSDYWVVEYISSEEESYELTVSPTSLSFAAAGETKDITVTSNDSWTVSSDQSWCTISPSSGSNNGTIKVTAAANSSTSSRSATITIKGANSGTKTVSVAQEGAQDDGYIGRDEYGDDNNLNNK